MTLHYTTATVDRVDVEITFWMEGGELRILTIEHDGPPTLAMAMIDEHPDVAEACRIKARAAAEWNSYPPAAAYVNDARRFERECGLGED